MKASPAQSVPTRAEGVPHPHEHPRPEFPPAQAGSPGRRPTNITPTERASHHGHRWMMIACCLPMILLATVLVATGVVSPGFLLAAVACAVIMALMMRGMDHSGRSSGTGITLDEHEERRRVLESRQ